MLREMPEPQPVKVRSGNFRVDRKEALRKLAAYRLPDPAAFVLCWLRAAAASKPTWIQVTLDRERVEVRFDGKTWPAAAMEDPYTAFFEEGGAVRVRHLVTGSLAAFQLGARRVLVTSGGGAMALTPDTVEPLETPVDRVETAFEAQCPARFNDDQLPCMMAYVTRHGGMLEPQLSVCSNGNTWVVPPLAEAEGAPSLRFEDPGLRGLLRPPADPRARTGKASLYASGVLVLSVDWSFSPCQVDAHLDDEAFTLDASQSSVVMDSSFQRALDAAAARVPMLLSQTLERHESSYPDWARFLFDRSGFLTGLLGKARFDRPRATDHALAWLAGYGAEYSRLVAWDAGPGAWLRAAACALPTEEPEDPVLKRLFHARLYMTVNGTLMSLEDLDTTCKYTGQLPVCRTLFPGEYLDPPVVWCPWRDDPVVERRFGARARWHTDVSTFRDVRPAGKRK